MIHLAHKMLHYKLTFFFTCAFFYWRNSRWMETAQWRQEVDWDRFWIIYSASAVLSTWGRRMGRKLEQIRRSSDGGAVVNGERDSVRRRPPWRLGRASAPDVSPRRHSILATGDLHQAPSPLRNFFTRMGSTGMLNRNQVRPLLSK